VQSQVEILFHELDKFYFGWLDFSITKPCVILRSVARTVCPALSEFAGFPHFSSSLNR
jgi:hypothetical protein